MLKHGRIQIINRKKKNSLKLIYVKPKIYPPASIVLAL